MLINKKSPIVISIRKYCPYLPFDIINPVSRSNLNHHFGYSSIIRGCFSCACFAERQVNRSLIRIDLPVVEKFVLLQFFVDKSYLLGKKVYLVMQFLYFPVQFLYKMLCP